MLTSIRILACNIFSIDYLITDAIEFQTVDLNDGSDADIHEIKQQLESAIGTNELQQKLTQAKTKTSDSQSESGSIADRKSLSGSLHR